MAMTETGQFDFSAQGIDASRIFLDPIVFDVDMRNIFNIMPNVVSKKKMLFAGTLEDILRQRVGCGFKPVGNMNITERCVEVEAVKADVEQCFDEYVGTILQDLLRKGIQETDLTGTLMANIQLLRMSQGSRRQIEKLMFFGDKRDGTDPTRNFVDGMWTTHIPNLVSNNEMVRVNSQSGTPLGAGDAIDLFDAVIDGATNELDAFDDSDKVFFTTRQVWRQLQKDIRNGVQGSEGFATEVINGRSVLTYNGIEIVKMVRWEGLAAQYMGGGSNPVLPGVTSDFNLVLLTHRQNLVLATDRASDMNNFDMWYDRQEEKTKTKSAFKIGANYIHPSLMVAAY